MLSLQLLTTQGVDSFRSDKSTASTVSGFSSLDQPGLNDLTGNQSCLVIVDTGSQQSLWVGFADTEQTPPPGGYQAMCGKAHIAAESIMQQLLAKSP